MFSLFIAIGYVGEISVPSCRSLLMSLMERASRMSSVLGLKARPKIAIRLFVTSN